jgi:hypothetical protein
VKTLPLRSLRCATARPRRLALLFAFTLALLLLAHPGAFAADVFSNIGPAPQLPPGGWVGRYPVERYSLDQDFSAISVGLTSGVDASGVAPMIAYFGAQVLWLITCFLANGVILLFALAFNLNLLTGNGTPGSGALTPVSAAIHNLYTNTFGTPWLVAMVTLVGCWAMWKALVQRRYTETAGALAVSFVYFVLAIGIVTQPEQTIGPASKLSNELSTSLLSLTNEGSLSDESKAKTAASNQLFELLVLNPWTVLEFGGVEHCATLSHGKPHSVAVRPLSSNPAQDTHLAARLENATEVNGEGGKTCINDRNKYATHFLEYPFQSPSRNSEHEALEHGNTEDLPSSDPAKKSGTYPLGPVDAPAAEAMGKGGQYQRLLLAIVILLGEVGAYLLLGALALGVLLAQILLLTLLAFAPVALLIGIFPGRGHDFFRSWLTKLAGYLARKVVYSLILAVVLAVCRALDDATSNLGWLLAFALQAAFLWTVFLQRDRLTRDLLAGTIGPRATQDGTSRLANLYFATRLARMIPLPSISGRSRSDEPPAPPSGSPGGTPSPGESPPSGGEGPQGGTRPPSTGAPGEETPPPADGGHQGPHETPTHGAGAPTPGASTATSTPTSSATGEASSPPEAPLPAGAVPPTEGQSSQSQGSPPHPPRTRTPDDEPPPAAAAKRTSGTLNPGVGVSMSAPPGEGADRPLPPRVPSTGSVASTPPSAALPAPAVIQPPAVPAPSAPAPGVASRTSSGDSLGEDEASHPRPRSAVVKPPARGGTPPVNAPAIPAEEPVALLLRARQPTGPADPMTTKEDDPA